MRILLLEDDTQIGSALVTALGDNSYTVDWVEEGESGAMAMATQSYSIILLDLGLPKVDGLALLRKFRDQNNKTPIIIITARDQTEDRIRGLDLGADDYLVKPFSVNELLARIRALLRRASGEVTSNLQVAGVTLNLDTCQVTRNGHEHALTQKEFALLRVLMTTQGKVFSKSELEDQLYGWGEEVSSNVIEFTIHGLRKKVGKEIIKNIRGLGWMVPKE